jgi:UDP-3-O-[3-hydroxymyristoyl] glucosamine N-acyltransferase
LELLGALLPGDLYFLGTCTSTASIAMRMTFGAVVLLMGLGACATRSEEAGDTRVATDTVIERRQVEGTLLVRTDTTVASDTTIAADTTIVADTTIAADTAVVTDTTVASDTTRIGDEGVISVDTTSSVDTTKQE